MNKNVDDKDIDLQKFNSSAKRTADDIIKETEKKFKAMNLKPVKKQSNNNNNDE